MSKPLTYALAEILRKHVTIKEFPALDIRVISGTTEMAQGEVRGSLVLRAVPGASHYCDLHQRGWIWKKDGTPTIEDREFLKDFPGISNNDPVTWGHLQALGVNQ